ncbi:DUF3331 domain-containing protein [Paraburkholderia flagellata]|uniref:DUF3331 domain-containing protein n=1 Tax=Paraburkholderia flagellata TaxID=2883241 RepID=UPI003570E53E
MCLGDVEIQCSDEPTQRMVIDRDWDAWEQIIQGLSNGQARETVSGDLSVRQNITAAEWCREESFSGSAYIHIVEWVSDDAVIMRWRDSRSGVYGEQRWVLTLARRSKRCALSGATIRRGDLVFRPAARRRFVASNSQVEILPEPLRQLATEAVVRV